MVGSQILIVLNKVRIKERPNSTYISWESKGMWYEVNTMLNRKERLMQEAALCQVRTASNEEDEVEDDKLEQPVMVQMAQRQESNLSYVPDSEIGHHGTSYKELEIPHDQKTNDRDEQKARIEEWRQKGAEEEESTSERRRTPLSGGYPLQLQGEPTCHFHGCLTQLSLDSFLYFAKSNSSHTLVDLIFLLILSIHVTLSYLTHHFTPIISHSLSFLQNAPVYFMTSQDRDKANYSYEGGQSSSANSNTI